MLGDLVVNLREENLVLTYASGEDFFKLDSFWVFVKTLSRFKNIDKVIITHDIPHKVCDCLYDFDFEIVNVSHNSNNIMRDRHLGFWEYLNEHGHKYKYVGICDSKDVVFQQNPFDWIDNKWKPRFDNIKGNKNFLDNFVIVTSEGFRQSQSGFARIEDFVFQSDIPSEFVKENSNRWVINGGVIFGTPFALQNHEFLLWSVSVKTIGKCTDQASLNYLMNYLEKDETYSISQPFNDILCLHGEGVKEGFVKEPIVEDNLLKSSYLKEPYFIIHQWDRLSDCFKQCILAHLEE